jgi:hypothetical protein
MCHFPTLSGERSFPSKVTCKPRKSSRRLHGRFVANFNRDRLMWNKADPRGLMAAASFDVPSEGPNLLLWNKMGRTVQSKC